MIDRVGQRIGNYRLIRLLGEGSFAEVYLGEHGHLGTEAAIKVLTAHLVGREVERFREEARMIARLKHAHIVRVLDFDVEEETPFLVMDFAPGGTLRQRYPRGTRLAPLDILPYIQQIASALQYAHDHRLIHRDIKPENILVGESGEILVSDFGIAVLLEKAKTHITMDVFAGSPAYAAPEQFQNKPRPASDQYALGVLAYEWLSGERPFQGLAIAIGTQKALYPPPPLRVKVPTLSPAVEQVVMTALAADPRARFASVCAFAAAFEQACQPAHDQFQTRPQPPEQAGALVSFAPTQRLSPPPAAQHTPAPALPPASPLAGPHLPMFFLPAAPASPTRLALPQLRLSRRMALIAGGLVLAVLISVFVYYAIQFHQHVTTGPHITSIQVGTGFNGFSLQGVTDTFHIGETVWVAFNVSSDDAQANVVDGLYDSHNRLIHTSIVPYGEFYTYPYDDFTTLTQTGVYTWKVDYDGTPEASITFQVT